MDSDLPCFLYLQIIHFMALFLQWYQKFTNVDDVIPISAKFGHGVDDIKEWILSKLPLGPAYYPKVLTWKMQKFHMASSEEVFVLCRDKNFLYHVNLANQVEMCNEISAMYELLLILLGLNLQ